MHGNVLVVNEKLHPNGLLVITVILFSPYQHEHAEISLLSIFNLADLAAVPGCIIRKLQDLIPAEVVMKDHLFV